jgi:hypothetical protein
MAPGSTAIAGAPSSTGGCTDGRRDEPVARAKVRSRCRRVVAGEQERVVHHAGDEDLAAGQHGPGGAGAGEPAEQVARDPVAAEADVRVAGREKGPQFERLDDART